MDLSALINSINQVVVEPSANWLFNSLAPRVYDLLIYPFVERQALWATAPLILTLVLLQFYFARYKKEKLGWNTAVGNSIVLLFVSADLLRQQYPNLEFNTIIFNENTIIALGILFWGFLLFFVNFFHFLPSRIAFFLSSPININLIAYFGVVIVYSKSIDPDGLTAISILVMYFAAYGFYALLKVAVPGYHKKIKEAMDVSLHDEERQP